MKPVIQLIAAASATFAFATAAIAAEAPDALIKRITADVLETVKADKDIQGGNRGKAVELVNSKILPHVDSEKMTKEAAGRFWLQATPEQQKQLTQEFKTLLVYTYSGALTQIKNQTVEFKPMRAEAGATDVEVRSQVNVPRGEPINLNYRLVNGPQGWKIYDINMLGAWLVQTHKTTFASRISKDGIDGLIKQLAEQNKQLAAKPLKAPK